MKTVLRLGVATLLALVVLTLVRYRHLDPCKALEREIVRTVERGVGTTADSLEAALDGLGKDAAEAVGGVASAVGDVAVGVAREVARAKVEHMSRRECVAELWDMARTGG